MATFDYTEAEKHLRAQAPMWCRFAGRRRLVGVIEIVWLTMQMAPDEKDPANLLQRVRPKLEQAYGSIWVILLIRIAMILIQLWLEKRDG